MNRFFLCALIFLLPVWSFAQRTALNKRDTSEVQWIKGSKFYVYQVEKGETVYSITKRFNVTEDELKKNNPDLRDGLKTKMQLLIPASGGVKKSEPEKKSEAKKNLPKEIHVALMLPVNIWKSFIPDSLRSDTAGNRETDPEVTSQLEFYEGAMHALDSLASAEMKIHLSIFDTENDTSRVNLLLRDPAMKDVNYIVVNGNQYVLRRLNVYASSHHVALLTFNLNGSESLRNNPQAYALSPSSVTQCSEAGKFCAQKFKGANVVALRLGTSREHERSAAFCSGWNETSEIKCHTLDYSKEDFTALLAGFSKTGNNVLFIPSSNEDLVNSIVTKLNDTTDVYQVTVIGIPTWQYFESNDPAVMANLHTHLFTASHLNREDPSVMSFRKFFRNEYYTEPTEPAYQGYDVITLIAKSISGDAKNFPSVSDGEGLFSNYHLKAVNGLNENQYIRMMRYENYQLVEVK